MGILTQRCFNRISPEVVCFLQALWTVFKMHTIKRASTPFLWFLYRACWSTHAEDCIASCNFHYL